MKMLSKIALVCVGTLLCYSAAYATSVPNTDDPKTFLGPTARLGFTSTINDYTAYNLAGEAGNKNFRIGGTLGWALTNNQLLKVSAEYLWQRITYAFFSGNSDQWVQQGALGAAYQYTFLDYIFLPQFDLSAYVSHAPSKTVDTVNGVFNNNGTPTTFIDTRRIAGSNGAGVSPGIAIMPWQGGRISAALNYDSVRYDNKYVQNEDAKGWGGTVGFNQAITDNIGLGLSAAVRQPFNNYAANLSWANIPYLSGAWAFGVFGDYTIGKNTLPDTWNVGLSADYFLDRRCGQAVPVNLKGERNLKGEVALQPRNDGLLGWTADPAVYMPQVLAIVDERVTTSCTAGPVSVTSGFPNLIDLTTTQTINVASHFSGNNLIFSSSVNGTIKGSISPSTVVTTTPGGILTIIPAFEAIPQDFFVTVTAANSCGIASTTFEVTIPAVVPIHK